MHTFTTTIAISRAASDTKEANTQTAVTAWQFDWTGTLALIHDDNHPTSLHTSVGDCRRRSHRIEKMHGMLPTQAVMAERRPDLYINNYCRACTTNFAEEEEPVETQDYLWECPASEATTDSLTYGKMIFKRTMTDHLSPKARAAKEGKTFAKTMPTYTQQNDNTVQQSLQHMISYVPGQLSETGDLHGAHITARDLYRGLVPLCLSRRWKELFQTTTTIVRRMALRFVKQIENGGEELLWNARCTATVAWERDLRITAVSKKKRRQRDGDERHPGSSSGTFELSQAQPVAENVPYEPYDANAQLFSYLQGKLKLSVMERGGK
ncbi:hypothetical protein DFQ26_001696, partial [Actinomortierella ambigua]